MIKQMNMIIKQWKQYESNKKDLDDNNNAAN